jgi:hypothetical protein
MDDKNCKIMRNLGENEQTKIHPRTQTDKLLLSCAERRYSSVFFGVLIAVSKTNAR